MSEPDEPRTPAGPARSTGPTHTAGATPACRVALADLEHPALVAYRVRNRRAMRRYAAVLAVLVLLAVIAVRLAYAHGELNKASNRTAIAATPIPSASPGTAMSARWRSDDRPAGGNPYSDGIVVTYAGHTVNGRDASTGDVRWYYTRSDQKVCSTVQQDRSTIAIYDRGGNCDEVTGFDTATGKPKWYRTLTDNGQVEVASAPNVVLIVAATTVHVIDNAGGLDRWSWSAPAGCAVDRSLAGSQGVLTSYHCGDDHHLALHDLTSSADKWNIAVAAPMVPVAAGIVVGAADPRTATLTSYSSNKGAKVKQVSLGTAAAVSEGLATLPRAQASVEGFNPASRAEFVRAGPVLALGADTTVRWSAGGTGEPSLIADTLVAVPDGSEVVVRAASDGKVEQRIALPGVRAGRYRVYPVGSGLVVAATTTEVFS